MTVDDLYTILPLIILVSWALALLMVDLWIPRNRKGITAILAALGLVVVIGVVLGRGHASETAFNGMVVVDGFAVFLDIVFLAGGLAAIALAYDYLKRLGIERGEYYTLLLLTISGMMLMTYASDLIMVFLALEFLSIPLYILAGFARLHLESEEAALKYFLLGAFSSAIVLYGISLIFAGSGATQLYTIVAAIQAGEVNYPLFLVGAAMLLVGFSFKSAIVPFHMWVPDVYQGAPSSVSGFMTVGAKAAGFAALMRVFVIAFPALAVDMTPILWALAALTMVVGNIAAIKQRNIKRLLAYASIAQSGYLMMAFVPYGESAVLSDTIAAMLFYLVAYSLTTFGAWAVIIALEKAGDKGLQIEDYAGLGRKHTGLALAMTVFMLSFTGVPLTLGFWGKFYLFSTAVEGGFVGLALIGLLTSVVSAFYYLRVVAVMFMQPGEPLVRRDPWLNLTAGVSAVAIVAFSLLPGPLLLLAAQAAIRLF
ncbi:MAG TPA: NADH-quinone oxidoreductase subunit N [Levilinea sp.]|nr:NADH-quinone oxidoreductase subunit N [Levilinea sp.]